MSELISWCDDCGCEAVYDAIPESDGREFVCRACGAAVIAEADVFQRAVFA